MPRINGLTESALITADTLVKAYPGEVHSITIAYKGVTAGEIFTLKDGLDATAGNKVVFVFPAGNGVMYREWSQGKKFDTGIFANKGATVGEVFVEMTYK